MNVAMAGICKYFSGSQEGGARRVARASDGRIIEVINGTGYNDDGQYYRFNSALGQWVPIQSQMPQANGCSRGAKPRWKHGMAL